MTNNLNREEEESEAIAFIEKYRRQTTARRRRYYEKKKRHGYSLINSLWVQLDDETANELKKYLNSASKEDLLQILNLLKKKQNNDFQEEFNNKTSLEEEIYKYIQSNQQFKFKEMSKHLLELGLGAKPRSGKKRLHLANFI